LLGRPLEGLVARTHRKVSFPRERIMPHGTEGGSVSYRCPVCKRSVRSAPSASLQDRHPRKITRYHGNVAGA